MTFSTEMAYTRCQLLCTFLLGWTMISTGVQGHIWPVLSNRMAIHVPSIAADATGLQQMYTDSAQFALQQLNEKRDTKLELKEIDLESCRVMEGMLVSLLVGTANGMNLMFDLVSPLTAHYNPMNMLPAPEDSTALVSGTNTPHLHQINLQGPLQLFFEKPRDDVTMNLPHSVEAGTIRKITIDPGVNVTLTGATGMRLVQPIGLNLVSHEDSEELSIEWNGTPKVEVIGKSLFFKSEDRIKAKRKGHNELEFLNVTSSEGIPSTNENVLKLTPDSPLFELVRGIIEHTQSIAPAPIKKIWTGSAQAVTIVMVPMSVTSNGVPSNWRVMVTLDSNGGKKLVSSEQLNRTEVTVSEGLILNGTLPMVLDNFKPLFGEETRKLEIM